MEPIKQSGTDPVKQTQDKREGAVVDSHVVNTGNGQQIGVKHLQNSPLGKAQPPLSDRKATATSADKTASVAQASKTDAKMERKLNWFKTIIRSFLKGILKWDDNRVNNFLNKFNNEVRQSPELENEIEKTSAKLVKEIAESSQGVPENPSKTSSAPATAPSAAPVPTAAPDTDTVSVSVPTTASSKGVVSPKPSTISSLDAARNKLDEMIRNEGNDPRASAQLFLLKSQLAKAERTDAVIGIVERISSDPGLIARAVELANKTRENEMKRDEEWGKFNIRSERSNTVEGNAKWEEMFLNEILNLIPLNEEDKALRKEISRLQNENKRPNFKELADNETSRYRALKEYVSAIEKTIEKTIDSDGPNLFGNFLKTKTAKNALENPNFDLETRFEADLISQLGGGCLGAIEEMK
jgi:hypothetical protein